MTLLLLFNQPTSAVTAFLRPDADDYNADNWVDQAGNSTNIFSAVDEASADDADYILSPAVNLGGTGQWNARFKLSNPAVGKTLVEPIRVRYRFRKTNTGAKVLMVLLKQDTADIAWWSHSGTEITESFQTVEQTLTAPQVAAITDFNDLFIEFLDYEV